MILALASEHVTFWWITLGLGAVVVTVVIVLLSLLTALVDDIDRNVAQTWETATRVAANTATTWMLNQAVGTTTDLRNEVNLHAELLSAGAGGRR